ncbi:MAG: protein-glutamate O-methyltransferase [Syntrophobacterales bacterium]|jgi:chemotaxis protein methyltransferase CheR|nr:protein-glutamate O-methyltransferase [Syntrophobacterales bacterium]
MELKQADFQKISRLIYDQCGISLHEGKKELVKARLGKRLQEGNFTSFSDYYRHITTEAGQDELILMLDSISTNLTYFFRESAHFDKLQSILPPLMEARLLNRQRKLQIWSAACSSGEEPYSLGIFAKELLAEKAGFVSILATDISTRVLKAAVQGIFPQDRMKNVPDPILKKYFQYGSGKRAGFYRVKEDVRNMVRFKRFNLMTLPPADFASDIIFCRNVMIYFDKPTQERLVDRLYKTLNGGGYFFIGHSESLTGLKHSFKYIGPSIYQK